MTTSEGLISVLGLVFGYIVVSFFLRSYERSESTNNKDAKYHVSDEQDTRSARECDEDQFIKESQITQCVMCKQRIRVPIPLPASTVRCVNCGEAFEVFVDENDVLQARPARVERHNEHDPIRKSFDVLGIAFGASSDEIKWAYKRKVMEYHPDKVAHLGERLRELADLETKKLNAAYRELKEAGYI